MPQSRQDTAAAVGFANRAILRRKRVGRSWAAAVKKALSEMCQLGQGGADAAGVEQALLGDHEITPSVVLLDRQLCQQLEREERE
jgi:hypothetical protein